MILPDFNKREIYIVKINVKEFCATCWRFENGEFTP